MSIILELLPDTDETDPALINSIGRELVDTLQQNGYILHPVYTRQRGGAFVVEVVNAVTDTATYLWTNRAAIEEAVNDTSALVTIFGTVIPAIKYLFHVHEQQVGKDKEAIRPVKISVVIDGAQIDVETQDLAQANAALTLAQQFASAHPHIIKQVSARSETKVQGRIPPKPPRRRK